MKGKTGIIITSIIIAFAIIATGITVFALNSSSGKNSGGNGSGRQFSGQTRENMQANNETWSKLTDDQKKECYAILDELSANQIKLIEKEAELGLIDKDNAAKMKEMIETQLSTIKENDRAPEINGFGFGGGGGRGTGMAPSDIPSDNGPSFAT